MADDALTTALAEVLAVHGLGWTYHYEYAWCACGWSSANADPDTLTSQHARLARAHVAGELAVMLSLILDARLAWARAKGARDALNAAADEADRVAHIGQTSWDDLEPEGRDVWRNSTLAAVHKEQARLSDWLRERAAQHEEQP